MCFLIHDWGKWEDTSEGDVKRGELTVGRWLNQKRTCKTCGKTQLRTEET